MDIFQSYFLIPWRKNVVYTLQPRNTRLAIKLNKVAQTKQMKQISQTAKRYTAINTFLKTRDESERRPFNYIRRRGVMGLQR